MANYPDEKGLLKFNIRIATPPPGSKGIPPGKMSSYVFNLKPGDKDARVRSLRRVLRQGHARRDGLHRRRRRHGADALAHLRPAEALHTERKISFWYGARSLREMFYVEDFDGLAARTRTSAGTSRCPIRSPRTTGPGSRASSTRCCTTTT
jgi:Na+-transporting NADH:ubiquinone oxidoreductase subunit F